MKNSKRLRELDFLRGIAILLVLFRHQFVFAFTQTMGWIGVDLFFVLSGFLVSGLLFKEYMKTGSVRPGLFLIRRGFKIYPIYFLFYGLYLIPILIKGKFEVTGFLSDMFFVQNYVLGWGYAYAASWSLAVEEHFYIGFALLFYVGLKYGLFKFDVIRKFSTFEAVIILIMASCITLRFVSNTWLDITPRLITMTHLRIDSLLAGVLLSYWFHFKKAVFTEFVTRNITYLLILCGMLLSFTPFLDQSDSEFVRTAGFTFLYVAFAIVLSWFITDGSINKKLDRMLTRPVVDFIGRVGLASYSIYIIHTFVNYSAGLISQWIFGGNLPSVVMFAVTSAASIFIGMAMTRYIETYFLRIRDKLYPAMKYNPSPTAKNSYFYGEDQQQIN